MCTCPDFEDRIGKSGGVTAVCFPELETDQAVWWAGMLDFQKWLNKSMAPADPRILMLSGKDGAAAWYLEYEGPPFIPSPSKRCVSRRLSPGIVCFAVGLHILVYSLKASETLEFFTWRVPRECEMEHLIKTGRAATRDIYRSLALGLSGCVLSAFRERRPL